MRIRYTVLVFSVVVLFTAVSFAGAATDPQIIFGNSPTGTPLSQCAFPNTCTADLGTFATPFSGGVQFPGSTPAENQTGNLTFFNDTNTTFESFMVSVDTPFFGPLSCAITNDGLSTFNTATSSGKSCIFSETLLTTLDPQATFDLQFVHFTDSSGNGLPSLEYGFNAPEPSTFVLLGTGLVALALFVGRKRMQGGVKPTWAS